MLHYTLHLQNVLLTTGPFYSCVLSFQVFDLEWGWRWPSCDIDQYLFSILQTSLHLKGSKVCIKTRSPLASLLLKGLATKHATVSWTIPTPSPKNSGTGARIYQLALKYYLDVTSNYMYHNFQYGNVYSFEERDLLSFRG